MTIRSKACPDCNADAGLPHRAGCDVARCTVCGGQRIGCEHAGSSEGWGHVWTGEWPGDLECRLFGWYAIWSDPVNRTGECLPATAETPGAFPDLNRLAEAAATGEVIWSIPRQRFVLPSDIDLDAPCPHPDFEVQANIIRRTNDTDPTIVVGFTAEIRVVCVACDEPFTWMGPYPVGLLPDRPSIDPSAQELRAPLRPRSSEPSFGLGLPGFQARWTDEGPQEGTNMARPDDHGMLG